MLTRMAATTTTMAMVYLTISTSAPTLLKVPADMLTRMVARKIPTATEYLIGATAALTQRRALP